MADIAELALKVETRELKQANADMEKFGKTSKKAADTTSSSMRRMGAAVAGTLAGLGVAAFSRQIIANTIEQERVIAQLDQTLRSTGRYTPELSQQMQDFASALQGVTTYGDEAVIAAQAMLLTFTQIGGETFGRAQQAILDVATAMGTDLKSATLQVGKALNDPIKGVSALAESGIQFTDVQRDMINAMVEAGDVADAQAIILAELETQFGGSARAARDTLGGSLQSLKNAFGDLLEGDSGGDGVRGATQAINDLTDVLSDPATKQAFANVTGLVVGMVEALANAVTGFDNLTTSIADYVQGIQTRGMTETQRLAHEIEQINIEANELQATLKSPDWLLSVRGLDRGELEARLRSARLTAQGLQGTLNEMKVSDGVADVLDKLGGFAEGDTGPSLSVPTAPGVASGGGSTVSDELKKQQEEIAKTIAGYQEQADTLGMSSTELALYKLEMQGATDEQIRQAATLLQLADAYQMQADAELEAQQKRDQARAALGTLDPIAGEQQKFEEELEQLRLLNEMKLIEDARYLELKMQLETEHAEQMRLLEEERFRALSEGNELLFASLDQLQAKGGEVLVGLATGATNGEEAMRALGQAILNEAVNGLVQMGIEQVKNFIMGQTQQAAATAAGVASGATLAAAYAPAAAAASVATVGAAPVAGLTSLATSVPAMLALFAASFEGGGFTGGGSRSGGIDGRGGFPAILHPNETVLDHTQGQGMGGTVVNINKAPEGTTVKRSRDASGNEVIDVIIADLRSDGPVSRQMQQTFGNRRVGA